jgi:zinc protease
LRHEPLIPHRRPRYCWFPLAILAPCKAPRKPVRRRGRAIPQQGECGLGLGLPPLPPQDDPWLYQGSDIPHDKEWSFGTLSNGLRWAVRANSVPPGQVPFAFAWMSARFTKSPKRRALPI